MKNIVLEVGCNRGQDTGKLYEKYKVPVWGFEPIPELQKDLSNRFKNNPDVTVLPYAIDITEGSAHFNVIVPKGATRSNYGCSSLLDLPPDDQVLEVSQRLEVKKTRLETFLDSIEFDEIEYIHCDAQGNDLNVIMSLGRYLPKLKAGCIEVVDDSLYENPKNMADDAVAFLSFNGFNVKSLTPQSHNPYEYNLFFERKVITL